MKALFAHAMRACLVFAAASAVYAADPLPRGDPAKAGFSAEGLQRIDRFFADEIASSPGGSSR